MEVSIFLINLSLFFFRDSIRLRCCVAAQMPAAAAKRIAGLACLCLDKHFVTRTAGRALVAPVSSRQSVSACVTHMLLFCRLVLCLFFFCFRPPWFASQLWTRRGARQQRLMARSETLVTVCPLCTRDGLLKWARHGSRFDSLGLRRPKLGSSRKSSRRSTCDDAEGEMARVTFDA